LVFSFYLVKNLLFFVLTPPTLPPIEPLATTHHHHGPDLSSSLSSPFFSRRCSILFLVSHQDISSVCPFTIQVLNSDCFLSPVPLGFLKVALSCQTEPLPSLPLREALSLSSSPPYPTLFLVSHLVPLPLEAPPPLRP